MPRRASLLTTVEGDCHLEFEQLLKIVCDLQLYSRFPALAVFRPKIIWLQDRVRQLKEQRTRDGKLRKLYYDIVEGFKDLLWELKEAHEIPEGFAAFMRERHNIVATRFVCATWRGQVILV